MFESPFEAFDVSRAQSELAAAFYEEESVFELFSHKLFHYVCRTVGRAVVDDENVEYLLQSENGPYDFFDVFNLVVCRDYYNAVTHVYYSYLMQS